MPSRPVTFSKQFWRLGVNQVDQPNASSSEHDAVRYDSDVGLLSAEKNTTSTSIQHVQRSDTSGKRNKLWSPFALSRRVLGGFVALYCICIAAFLVLYKLSDPTAGLVTVATASSTQRYLWTYLPTTLFTLLATAWSQVDYRSKQMMPWITMQQRAQAAENSLLLDYITPMNIVSLFRATKSKHWLTASAVTGTLSLQVLIFLSTGLFTSRSTRITDTSSTGIMKTTFDPESYKNGANITDIPIIKEGSVDLYNSKDAEPWDLYFATAGYSMSFPEGTTDRYVYQQFNHSMYDNMTVTAVVDVFSAYLICDAADVVNISVDSPAPEVVIPTAGSSAGTYNWTIASGDCSNFTINLSILQLPTLTESMVFAGPGSCNNTSSGDAAMRLAFLAGEFTQIHNYNTSGTPWQNLNTNNYSSYTAIICRPEYQIMNASVSRNSSGAVDVVPDVSYLSSTTPRHLSNLSAWDIARPMPYTFIQKYYNYWETEDESSYWFGGSENATMRFTDVLNSSYPQNLGSDFQDSAILEEAAKKFYRAWTAQFAGRFLTVPAHEQIALNTTMFEDRLYTRGPTLWLSEACLCILILTSLCIISQSPRAIMSRDPSSIGGLATVLAGSHTVTKCLTRLGQSPDGSFLQKQLQPYEAALHLESHTGTSRIEITEKAVENEPQSITAEKVMDNDTQHEPTPKVSFYVPFAASKIAMYVIILAPLCAIIVMEILYIYSQNHEGIITVPNEDYVHYTWSYIPAIAMSSISLFHGSLESVVKEFQPFHAFHQGDASIQTGLLDNYLRQTAIQTLWTAGSKRQWAVAAVALSSMAGHFLTIFVSGLFELRYTSDQVSGHIRRADHFNSSMSDGYGSTVVANIVVDNPDTKFPSGTYDTLVLPQIDMESLKWAQGRSSDIQIPKLRITLPALRANVNCTVFEADQILDVNYTTSRSELETPQMSFKAIPPQPNCSLPFSTSGYSSGAILGDYEWPWSKDGDIWFEDQFRSDKYFGSWFEPLATGNLTNKTDLVNRTYHEQKPDCPRVITFFSSIVDNKVANTTAFYCHPYVEQVDVNVTYTLPDLDIDYDTPPIADESTAQFYSDTMNSNLDSSFTPVGSSDAAVTWSDTGFYDALLYGRNAVADPATLVGEVNQERLKKAINKLYGTVMADYINKQRISLKNDSSSEVKYYNATLLNATRSRLFQDGISTRVLQSLLAIMVVCAVVVFATMDTRHILPVNPSSIGAVASLLAGSDMLHDRRIIPHGAEWCNDGQLRENGVFQGYIFSLGWWGVGGSGGEKMRFGIDVGQADKYR